MNSIPDLLTSFETSLAELDAKQKQLQATRDDLKARQYAAAEALGDSSIPFDARVQEGVAIQLLQDDVKLQTSEESALSSQVTRAAGEIRSLIRAELNTRKYARIQELSEEITRDYVAIKLPLGPGSFECQHRSLVPWDALSNGLSCAMKAGDDWAQFVVKAKEALAAVS